MFEETKDILSASALKKVNFMKESLSRYILASAWAGFYVGLGIVLIMFIGSFGLAANSEFTKMLMGLSFGIALSLVIMVGSELFTGNNLIMTVGALDKKVSWFEVFKIWFFSYIGNFIGSIIVAGLFVMTEVSATPVGDYILNTSSTKMNAAFLPLLFKGILCNILVCLAVLSSLKMKSESGKLIIIFWCLFAFITSGYEHSIANMSIFAMSLLMPHGGDISVLGMFSNLIPVTIGNIIGGALMLGTSYYFMGSQKTL